MTKLADLTQGYQQFKEKYVEGQPSILARLSKGQKPQVMVLSCCDARVDPALLLQCHPGDLFIARSIANFVMPFSKSNEVYQGLSAALEFGVRVLKVEHLIILGHSQCGGIEAVLDSTHLPTNNDFISRWLSTITVPDQAKENSETCAKAALIQSYQNCLTFPWINHRVTRGDLTIHLWFFDIKTGLLTAYCFKTCRFHSF